MFWTFKFFVFPAIWNVFRPHLLVVNLQLTNHKHAFIYLQMKVYAKLFTRMLEVFQNAVQILSKIWPFLIVSIRSFVFLKYFACNDLLSNYLMVTACGHSESWLIFKAQVNLGNLVAQIVKFVISANFQNNIVCRPFDLNMVRSSWFQTIAVG